ncbi:hypothetical protein C8T65DRAFT_281733 [Cerioporus squamosus]|nr:hypothetical protein C8T65DRAFT_281733 [Cerioporus squamosus]
MSPVLGILGHIIFGRCASTAHQHPSHSRRHTSTIMMLPSFAQTQRTAFLIAAACAATHALPLSADLSANRVDSKKELEESSFRTVPMQEVRRDLTAEMIDAESSRLVPSATVSQDGSMIATRAVRLDAAATTSVSIPTSQSGESCPVAVAVLTSKWQLDVFPIATLAILSCVLVLLTALITSHIIRIRRFNRSSPVLVSPPSPRSRNLSITVPSREASVKGDGGKSLHPITEDPFPSTPTQQRISTFARPLSPSPPYNPTRMAPPDSPARSTFTSKSLPNHLEKKSSFLSLRE